MKLTKKEERMLKSLPEATPVLRGKDAERFLKEFNEVNKRVEKMNKTLKERILAVADAEEVTCNDIRGHLVDLAIKATAEEIIKLLEERFKEVEIKQIKQIENYSPADTNSGQFEINVSSAGGRLLEVKEVIQILKSKFGVWVNGKGKLGWCDMCR